LFAFISEIVFFFPLALSLLFTLIQKIKTFLPGPFSSSLQDLEDQKKKKIQFQ